MAPARKSSTMSRNNLPRKRKSTDEPADPRFGKSRKLSSSGAALPVPRKQSIDNIEAPSLAFFDGGNERAKDLLIEMYEGDHILKALCDENDPKEKESQHPLPLSYSLDESQHLDCNAEAQLFDPLCLEYLDTKEEVKGKNGKITTSYNTEWPAGKDALDIEIHPVFDISKWDTTYRYTEEFHAAIRPALRLASHLLTERGLSAWWKYVHYATGTVKDKKAQKVVLVSNVDQVDPEVAYHAFQNRLKKLSKVLRWYIKPRCTADAETTKNAWTALKEVYDTEYRSKTCTFDGRYIIDPNDPAFDEVSPVIGISSEVVYRILSRQGSSKKSVSQDMRHQWRLAFVLVHEIAHSFYMLKSRKDLSGYVEPFTKLRPLKKGGRGKTYAEYEFEPYVYSTDPHPEIGWSWENSIIGGFMAPEPRNLDGLGPMMLRPWEFTWTTLRVGALVPMNNVKSWFQKSTWDNFEDRDPRLQLPNLYKRGESAPFIAERFGANPARAFHILYIDRTVAAEFDTIEERNKRRKKGGLMKVNDPTNNQCIRTWYAQVFKKDIRSAKFKTQGWSEPRGQYKDTYYDFSGPHPKWRKESLHRLSLSIKTLPYQNAGNGFYYV